MAPKVSAGPVVGCGFRRHHKQQQALLPTIRIKTASKYARGDNLAPHNSVNQHERRQESSCAPPASTSANAARSDEYKLPKTRVSGSDEDTAAADILRTLYFSGSLSKIAPNSPPPEERDITGLPLDKITSGDKMKPSDVALPCMQQTDFILHSWHAEEEGECHDCGSPASHHDFEVMDVDVDGEQHILTPALSPSLSQSQCSMSSDCISQIDPLSPVTPRLRLPSPSGAQHPAYTKWNSNNCSPGSDSFGLGRYSVSRHHEKSYSPAVHSSGAPAPMSGMISPPQSPVYMGHLNDPSYFNKRGSTSSNACSPRSPHSTLPHNQHAVLPRPNVGSGSNLHTTILSLPPPQSLVRPEPRTPVSPFDNLNTSKPTAPLTEKKAKSQSNTHSSKKTNRLPRPHCNVKYETAELDFIMYQRTTRNRAWDDVTASFNAALPRLRHYAEMDYLNLGNGDAAAAAMDRCRPRPERTTPGLQASYYRQRLALPLLDENGQLVFDAQTNKQMFTEVMVRDDKSRKRRMSGVQGMAGAKTGNPDDTRVHLVLYFPERVAHYDYWFVSAEDKELARQRAYDRNMQRARRGLPPWEPGSDDPETGILIRNKE